MREHLPLLERVDLNDALARVIQALQPLAAKTNTAIEFKQLEEPAVRHDRAVPLLTEIADIAAAALALDGGSTAEL